jgi:RNA:NAD 2'-phosphotransferase (TPT1/KptA family)
MKKPRISLGHSELVILREVYGIDLEKPDSIQAFQDRMQGQLKSLYEAQRQIYVTMYPHRKKRIPSGQKCSFCLRAENEVHGMAMHESGFNICNKCLKTIQKAGKDQA